MLLGTAEVREQNPLIPPPLLAAGTALTMWLTSRWLPIDLLPGPPRIQSGCVVIATGLCLDLYSIFCFIRARTTVNPLRLNRTKSLVVTGPNSWSRNPMYLGMVWALAGWGIVLGNPTNFFVLAVFVRTLLVYQIIPEERMLAEKFGDAYLSYAQQVNRWFGRRLLGHLYPSGH